MDNPVERRRHPRIACDMTGAVVASNCAVPCVIRDQSAGGARIAFEAPVYLRGAAMLSVGDVLETPFRTVWRSACEMGVAFD